MLDTIRNGNETTYDQVTVKKEPVNGALSDKAAERCRRYQQLAVCFGTLCVILMLTVIGVCVHLRESAASELNQMRSSQQVLLEQNQKLSADYDNLTIWFDNLTTTSAALETNITTLKEKYDNLTMALSVLEDNNTNLTLLNEKLREENDNMEKPWNELNVSRAQWSIDEYCPKKRGGRTCQPCQIAWKKKSSCYLHNQSDLKTWNEAQEDCRARSSNLTVIDDDEEKEYFEANSETQGKIEGFWIGLRAVEGKWKWINGNELTNQDWIQQQNADDGKCVIIRGDQEWKSDRKSVV